MIWPLLRAITFFALRWFYGPIEVQGRERFPAGGPVLVVGNHPNALVDALLIGWISPRPLRVTAKATLFANRVAAAVLRFLGVLPLRRASDEPALAHNPNRNRDTFRAVSEALARGGAVLIFPEGKSHDEPALAPLRSGVARMALTAATEGNVTGLRIVPVGLTFERKDMPRSRVLVQVGEPIEVDEWIAATSSSGGERVVALTADVDARLRAVTLNFESADDAARTIALATAFARLVAPERSVASRRAPLRSRVELVRALRRAAAALASAPAGVRERADALVNDLRDFDAKLARNRVAAEDLEIPLGVGPGAIFTMREGWLAALAAPVALWGRVNHWLPFHGARLIARRGVESAADPAMRTIVAGLALVLLFYALQTWLVLRIAGGVFAAAYVVSLPIAADVDFAFSERLRRVRRRAGTYLRFRRDPALQPMLVGERNTLRERAAALATDLQVGVAPELAPVSR